MERMQVCFGYRTAFQILREIDAEKLGWANGGTRGLPARAPSMADLEEVIRRIESEHPCLSIERPAHILLGTSSRCRVSSQRTPHVCTTELRGRSILRLSDTVGVCGAPFSYVQMAPQAEDIADLLELGYEVCGTYMTKRTSSTSAYQAAPLASVRALRDFAARNPSLNGARVVASAIPYLADGSASPRETKQALVLGLPHARGGYGLGIPRMNYEVRASPAARALTGKSFFRCDLCWPEAKLDVEYQSRWAHEGEAKRLEDSRRTNALAAMGWKVVCITNDELDSLAATDAIANTIRRHLGKRAQVRVPDHHARKLRLRRQLGLPVGYERTTTRTGGVGRGSALSGCLEP